MCYTLAVIDMGATMSEADGTLTTTYPVINLLGLGWEIPTGRWIKHEGEAIAKDTAGEGKVHFTDTKYTLLGPCSYREIHIQFDEDGDGKYEADVELRFGVQYRYTAKPKIGNVMSAIVDGKNIETKDLPSKVDKAFQLAIKVGEQQSIDPVSAAQLGNLAKYEIAGMPRKNASLEK